MTLHKPQKDSPATYLTAIIDEDGTTLTVADSNIFQNQPGIGDVTRLTLGFDTATTETVTVVSYGASNTIEVERGTPSYPWEIGTKIARVFTSYDLSEIHLALSDLNANDVTNGNSHDHQGGDGAQIPTEGIQDHAITPVKLDSNITNHDHTGPDWIQIPTEGIQDEAITAAKIANRRRRVTLASMTNGYLALAGTFVHGARLKYDPTIEARYANFHGVVPKDFLSDGILYVLISNFISITAVDALINVGVTRFSVDSYLGGFMDLETTLNVPGVVIGDPHYAIRVKAIPLANIAADDYIIGGVRLGSAAGGAEVIYQGAYLDYLADS